MRINAKFEKVSKNQFLADFKDTFNMQDEEILNIYENLKLPKRATKGSAGYDFYAPIKIVLKPGETIKVPTGIRAYMPEDYVLMIFPRSGLGFKYRMQLNNTVGIIDSDYYNAKNEGHIMIKITNDTNEGKVIEVNQLDGFAQGIFMSYGICADDDSQEERVGGFGSTTKR